MAKVELMKKVNIFIIGILASILFFFMIEVLFAHFINRTIIGVLDNQFILFLLILGLELITLPISIIVGIMIAQHTKRNTVLKASLLAYICNLVFLLFISYISLFIGYPDVFSEVSGVEIILIAPQVLVYFGIYILSNVILLFILSIVSYFAFFIIFLEYFHEYKRRKYIYKRNGW